ncbi:MAG: hypothetical protein AB7G47_20045 [Mycolicibacterium sp.]|uniref:hypothetical protein n=1 Tax=Mycolicibacterium sp. TaxID=2320850 RepID=UPI003D131231
MTAAGYCWLWWCGRPRWQRWMMHGVWATQVASLVMVMLAPRVWAAGLDSVFGFTGVRDSYGVPLTSMMFVNADDALFDWNGVLPRVHAGASISNGFLNAIGAAETGLIVTTVAVLLWVVRALQSTVWNDLFGSIFSTLGYSIDQVLNSAPFVGIGLLFGSLAGVLLIGVGRATAGRAVLGTTWLLGSFGIVFGRDLLSKLASPNGWINQVHSVATGVAGALMRRGADMRAGSPGGRFSEMETGFADATRQVLQQWMLGRVVDPGTRWSANAADAACSAAWTKGQMTGDRAELVETIANSCPQDVLTHIQSVNVMDAVAIWVVLVACLGVAAWFSWCALNCLFRVLFWGGFAQVFIVYGLIPGFPRRFLKLASGDFVKQLLSYGVYFVLTGVYVVILTTVWGLSVPRMSGSVMGQLVVTGVVMVLLVLMVRHVGRLHGQATGLPAAGDLTARHLAAPLSMGAAAGISATTAARAGSGGGPSSNSGSAARINAGLQAAQIGLSRLHPAMAAAGSIGGALGSLGAGAVKEHRTASREAAQERRDAAVGSASSTPSSPSSTSGGGSFGGGAGGPGMGGSSSPAAAGSRGGGRNTGRAGTTTATAAERAQRVRQDAAAIARAGALQRPGSQPVQTGTSGIVR